MSVLKILDMDPNSPNYGKYIPLEIKAKDGRPFTYEDLTEEQKKELQEKIAKEFSEGHGIPTKVSDLENDLSFMIMPKEGSSGQVLKKTDSGIEWAQDAGSLPHVTSVNGSTGEVEGLETATHAEETFAAKGHTHEKEEVTGLSQALAEAGKVKTVNGKSPDEAGDISVDLTNFSEKGHTHQTGEVLGLDKALAEAGKVKSVNQKGPDETGNITLEIPEPDMTDYAKKEHVHLLSEVRDGNGKTLSEMFDLVFGSISPSIVSDSVIKEDAKTLHTLYQADPKKQILQNDKAIKLLEKEYPDIYSVFHAPGININKGDYPEVDTFLGVVENSEFGNIIVDGVQEVNFDGSNLVDMLNFTNSSKMNKDCKWFAFYIDQRIMYICNDSVLSNISNSDITRALFQRKNVSIHTKKAWFNVRILSNSEWDKYLVGLYNKNFGQVDIGDLGFRDSGDGCYQFVANEELTQCDDKARYGKDGSYSRSYSSSLGSKYGFRPVLICPIVFPFK